MFQKKLRIYIILSNLVKISFQICSHWLIGGFINTFYLLSKTEKLHRVIRQMHIIDEMLTLFLYVRTTAHCNSRASVLEHYYQKVRHFHWARFPQLSLRRSLQTKQCGLLFQRRSAHWEREPFFSQVINIYLFYKPQNSVTY
jgi:hypothetical protein